jgi:hypothetical protein
MKTGRPTMIAPMVKTMQRQKITHPAILAAILVFVVSRH